ncbi:hypothetical protein [Nevskia sp.]|uniref:hypothetical protein n=1 Tax=Nevskia sp. TaxID=1929292 RepID=UPI0025D0CDBC|nr:hypothetical protein [Nevskia sp.]
MTLKRLPRRPRRLTVLVNLAVGLVAVAVDNLHLLGPALSPRSFAFLAFSLAVANYTLHTIKKRPTGARKPDELR